MTRRRRLAVPVALLLAASCATQQSRVEQVIATNPPDVALEWLRQETARHPDDLNLRSTYLQMLARQTDSYIKQARDAYQDGNPTLSRQLARRALDIAPNNDSAKAMLQWIDAQEKLDQKIGRAEAMQYTQPDDALALVNDVLREQPDNTRAAAVRDSIATRQPHMLATRLANDLNQPISVQFRDQPIISVFELITKITGLNFVFDHDVAGSVPTTIFANRTPISKVISMVLQSNQLDSKVIDRNTLLIYPKRPDKDAEYKSLSVRTFYLHYIPAPQMMAAVKQMLKTRDLLVDERTNAIIMRDSPDAIAVAEKLVSAMDLPQSEVMLDVEVLEVTSSDLLNLGINYPDSVGLTVQAPQDPNSFTTPTPGVLTMNQLRHINGGDILVNLGNPSITLNMLQSLGKTNTLANPRIRVKNREKARILIGNRVPVVTTTLSNNFSTESVNYQDVGLSLAVEPIINNDNEIQVKLTLDVSNIVQTITTNSGLVVYQIGTRTADTVMTVHNNETQALAGLLQRIEQDNTSGIPGLGRVPLLDRIFGTGSRQNDKTELILLITPHIVRTQPVPGASVMAFESGTENRMTIAPTDVDRDSHGVRMPPQSGTTPPAPPPPAPAPAPAAPPAQPPTPPSGS